eukprot:TRINITY_DN3502_c0_g1_i20.p1 TRINITY_DN3502_c0_g1~~TRINITY_DN3502_c0_g1_i20.p1  ORF type:complete len:249 (+),score=23.83 TRINITY_DN3502_c0_g1_i20:321-1067(+)
MRTTKDADESMIDVSRPEKLLSARKKIRKRHHNPEVSKRFREKQKQHIRNLKEQIEGLTKELSMSTGLLDHALTDNQRCYKVIRGIGGFHREKREKFFLIEKRMQEDNSEELLKDALLEEAFELIFPMGLRHLTTCLRENRDILATNLVEHGDTGSSALRRLLKENAIHFPQKHTLAEIAPEAIKIADEMEGGLTKLVNDMQEILAVSRKFDRGSQEFLATLGVRGLAKVIVQSMADHWVVKQVRANK